MFVAQFAALAIRNLQSVPKSSKLCLSEPFLLARRASTSARIKQHSHSRSCPLDLDSRALDSRARRCLSLSVLLGGAVYAHAQVFPAVQLNVTARTRAAVKRGCARPVLCALRDGFLSGPAHEWHAAERVLQLIASHLERQSAWRGKKYGQDVRKRRLGP